MHAGFQGRYSQNGVGGPAICKTMSSASTNLIYKVCYKETNEQMHGRNIILVHARFEPGTLEQKANTITTELREFSLMHLLGMQPCMKDRSSVTHPS